MTDGQFALFIEGELMVFCIYFFPMKGSSVEVQRSRVLHLFSSSITGGKQ